LLRQTEGAWVLTVPLGLEGLEQLNRVAGRIVDKGLLASVAGHDLVLRDPFAARSVETSDSMDAITIVLAVCP
jgi:hypothetical protein